MTRNVTIRRGEPDPDNSIELWVGHVHGEWQVVPMSDDADQNPDDWPVATIEEWLLELVGDLPEAIDEARNDPRMYVRDRSKPCDMNRVNLSNNPAAYATYHKDDEEWTVKLLDKDIAVDSLSDVLSGKQEQVLLFNETATAQSDECEREPRTRQLTAFTGIGEATACKLGDDIHRIEEMLEVKDGVLTDDVRSVVSSQYHDTLRLEVRDWYRKALTNRSAEELDPIDRQYLDGELDWKNPIESVDKTDDARSMCLLFDEVIEPDDRLQITTEEYGDLTIQVVERGENNWLHVTIEPGSTALGAEAFLEIPAPHEGKSPVILDEQDQPESGSMISDDGRPGVTHRRKITEVEKRENSAQ